MFRLELTDDLGRTLSLPLKSEGTITIGRLEQNDIVLRDKSVSRRHCLLHVAGETVEVEDMQSANGVIVRGQRCAGRVPLKIGDELIIGENRLFLRRMGPEADNTASTFLGQTPERPKNK